MNLYDGNMTILSSIAFTAIVVLLFGGGAYIALAAIWRLVSEPVPAGLGAMLARHGLDWGRLAAFGSVGEVSEALDRCAACRSKVQCGSWLATGQSNGYASFCPNTAFVERMKVAAQR